MILRTLMQNATMSSLDKLLQNAETTSYGLLGFGVIE